MNKRFSDHKLLNRRILSLLKLGFGSYEELPNTPEYETTRAHAQELLQGRDMVWNLLVWPLRIATIRNRRMDLTVNGPHGGWPPQQ